MASLMLTTEHACVVSAVFLASSVSLEFAFLILVNHPQSLDNALAIPGFGCFVMLNI